MGSSAIRPRQSEGCHFKAGCSDKLTCIQSWISHTFTVLCKQLKALPATPLPPIIPQLLPQGTSPRGAADQKVGLPPLGSALNASLFLNYTYVLISFPPKDLSTSRLSTRETKKSGPWKREDYKWETHEIIATEKHSACTELPSRQSKKGVYYTTRLSLVGGQTILTSSARETKLVLALNLKRSLAGGNPSLTSIIKPASQPALLPRVSPQMQK